MEPRKRQSLKVQLVERLMERYEERKSKVVEAETESSATAPAASESKLNPLMQKRFERAAQSRKNQMLDRVLPD